ncbi:McrB family protein [Photobacterium leiognathi]|uniref:McrB family protein n=1 Tax=Photobacterium leiognathi TaxID=553611 RepID=UPI0029810B0D|nr:AAA family ATPase [Photobacterium leiognathi]
MNQNMYFNQEMFDCLNRYGNTPNNRHEDEQQQHAYQVLSKAYSVTSLWADSLKNALFQNGYIKIRKSPVNQGNHFFDYNWAKIYPEKNSPKELAFTIGIGKTGAFLKVDTVQASKSIREKYLSLRDEDYSSLIKYMPIDELLSLTFQELVEWSKERVQELFPQYEKMIIALGLHASSGYKNKDDKVSIHKKTYSQAGLNQILYGPPGTGKTFHTIEAAVKAAEPTFYLDLNIDQLKGATQEQRAQLQSKFKELSDSKRIRFVTFHQSYGYEEFVEGLKAECNDEGQISYCVEAGIFKQICQDAKSSNAEHQQFDCALEKLKELCSDEQNPLRVKTSNKSEFDVVYRGGKTFLLDPVSAGKSCGYSASLENIKKLYLTGNKDGIYNISYVRGLLEYMREHLNLLPISQHEKQIQPYVLVIDEINRGNISKIFGELITLIEPSKRKGAEEALEVTLPYSGEAFSVPDNLHIIGTMNTADRSLALMDTALRRRFDFVEMMPKPELFEHKTVKNIDLTELLTTLNKRIEVLYDREHTLGHAFLFPVYNEQDEDKAFELLKAAFKNKIIPLLEEYFFDDWNKIRLVLGDNQKEAALCFVTKQEDSYESLFGTNHGLNLYEDAKVTFQLASFDGDDSVWDRPEAYIAIYTKG